MDLRTEYSDIEQGFFSERIFVRELSQSKRYHLEYYDTIAIMQYRPYLSCEAAQPILRPGCFGW
jgi:hypothetical protein